jgi:hypothetical protein
VLWDGFGTARGTLFIEQIIENKEKMDANANSLRAK